MIRVLIVDDEIRVIQDLEKQIDWKLLQVEHVFSARSAEEALEEYKLFRPELVISDIEMLQKSGIDLLRDIKKMEPQARIIFLTCHPEFEYMRDVIRLGGCDYLLKPVDYQELMQAIMRQVEQITQQNYSSFEQQKDIRGYADLEIGAKDYIREHLVENMKVADIADYLGVSEPHLMKVFRSQTGWSLIEYISLERMKQAGQFLRETDWSVGIIAGMCGYEDNSYFSRVFKKMIGVTPKEYRNRFRTEE